MSFSTGRPQLMNVQRGLDRKKLCEDLIGTVLSSCTGSSHCSTEEQIVPKNGNRYKGKEPGSVQRRFYTDHADFLYGMDFHFFCIIPFEYDAGLKIRNKVSASFLECLLKSAHPMLQDNGTYDIVGIEPIVDNEVLLHHFVMYGCSNTTENPGVVTEDDAMLDTCEEALFLWAPGTGKYTEQYIKQIQTP